MSASETHRERKNFKWHKVFMSHWHHLSICLFQWDRTFFFSSRISSSRFCHIIRLHTTLQQSSTTIYFILVDCRQSVCCNQGADRGLVSLSLIFFLRCNSCCTLKHWVSYPSIPHLFYILNLSLLLVEFDSVCSCGSKPFCSLLFLLHSITTL